MIVCNNCNVQGALVPLKKSIHSCFVIANGVTLDICYSYRVRKYYSLSLFASLSPRYFSISRPRKNALKRDTFWETGMRDVYRFKTLSDYASS